MEARKENTCLRSHSRNQGQVQGGCSSLPVVTPRGQEVGVTMVLGTTARGSPPPTLNGAPASHRPSPPPAAPRRAGVHQAPPHLHDVGRLTCGRWWLHLAPPPSPCWALNLREWGPLLLLALNHKHSQPTPQIAHPSECGREKLGGTWMGAMFWTPGAPNSLSCLIPAACWPEAGQGDPGMNWE